MVGVIAIATVAIAAAAAIIAVVVVVSWAVVWAMQPLASLAIG